MWFRPEEIPDAYPKKAIQLEEVIVDGVSRSFGAEIAIDWQAKDVKAGETIEAYLQLVADPLAVAVNTVGPSIVPVGGGLASAGALITALDGAVRARILNRFDRPLLVPAIRREDGGLLGAAVLARQGVADVRAA